MEHFEVFVDRSGHLVLNRYDTRNPSRIENIARKADVYYPLKELSKYPIRHVDIYEQRDLSVTFDGFVVDFINCDRLDRYEMVMAPMIKKVDKAMQQDRIREIKKSREQKGLNTAPKVKRTNKHSGLQLVAGAVVLATLATTAHFMLGAKAEESVKDNPPTNIEIVEVGNKDDEFSIDNLVFVDNKVANNTSNSNTISINYEDRSNTEKARKTKALYGDIIEKYAEDYGLDPILVTAIATQERGVHSSIMDKGGATGLMQIQNSVWVGHEVSAYNFDTGKKERFEVTNEMLGNVETNIKIGCMILQNAMEYMNYNVLAGIQCYNMGYGNMNKILTECAMKNGTTKQAILNDPNNISWMDYRDIISVGDQKYAEHVLSWIGPNVNIKVSTNNKDTSVLCCNNTISDTKVY